MSKNGNRTELNRLFHEPGRLAIMSALCGSSRGLTFNELKDQCALTDGNLSRHLKTLEEAGTVTVWKTVSGSRKKTTVAISDLGRQSFVHYLQNLETVLIRAAETLGAGTQSPSISPLLNELIGLKP